MLYKSDIHKIKQFWHPDVSKEKSIFLQGKKVKHSINIIGGLCLNDSSTTRVLSNFILFNSPDYDYKPVKESDSRILEQSFYKLIKGRAKKKIRGKKVEFYPSLLSKEYVYNTGSIVNEKKKSVDQFFPTFKGCIFALSFDFTRKDLLIFIKNASNHHLFFTFLQFLLNQKVPFSFVNEIFIFPIKDGLIKSGVIDFDTSKDFTIYDSIIAEKCVRDLWNKIRIANQKLKNNIKKKNLMLPSAGYDDFKEGKSLQKFLEAFTFLTKTSGKKNIQNLKILYEDNFKWREEILEKLEGQLDYNDKRLNDYYQFRLLGHLLLHLDAAIVDAFEVN